VDRALRAGALALGAQVEIETLPGYLPLFNHGGMADRFAENARALLGEDQVARTGHRSGSTDMGDISHVMPTLHPYMGGAQGSGHGADYGIADPRLAYVEPAKQLALMAVDMLYGGAEGARNVLRAEKPRLTKEAYLAFQRKIARTELFDGAAG